MENTNATTGWVVGIIIVALMALAIWWFTSGSASPGVPNTGAATSSYTQTQNAATGTSAGSTSTNSPSSSSSVGTTGSMGY